MLFQAMGIGALIKLLGELSLFKASNTILFRIGEMGKSFVKLGYEDSAYPVKTGGASTVAFPAVSPAYLGVGYIIGPELAALNFAGGLLSWGLLVPMFVYFLGPDHFAGFAAAQGADPGELQTWSAMAGRVWKFIVQPIAVGGMLVGAFYTLFSMRQNLVSGIKRSVSDLKQTAAAKESTSRVDRDLNFKTVLVAIGVTFVVMIALYYYFTGVIGGALTAAIVMLIAGFFFAAVSGNLVGLIGSSNNPVSGLTLATLVVSALMMVIIGLRGTEGVVATLAVATVVCVSSAVAGEMLQDLKVGHILGGTPWKMQLGDIIGVIAAGAFMFLPLFALHFANIKQGGIGFGDPQLAAPQAGLMATLARGIVGGQMAWPLVIVGMVMGVAMIMVRVKSPMLFSVGMYLPLETTFAIFVGGLVRWAVNTVVKKRGFNEGQALRVENAGILTAAGLIAGEGLMGLTVVGFWFVREKFWTVTDSPWGGTAVVFMVILIAYLVLYPLRRAGSPDEPPPPAITM
jgi:putative OPT family oligopeptide transporter